MQYNVPVRGWEEEVEGRDGGGGRGEGWRGMEGRGGEGNN